VSIRGFLEAVVGQAQAVPAGPTAGPEGDVWGALSEGSRSADEVARATGLPAGRVLAALAALELGGHVARLPGMRFRRAG